MKKVEIFKTNVNDRKMAKRVMRLLYRKFPDCRINFDLDDCDKVLRIEGEYLRTEIVRDIVTEQGIACEVIE